MTMVSHQSASITFSWPKMAKITNFRHSQEGQSGLCQLHFESYRLLPEMKSGGKGLVYQPSKGQLPEGQGQAAMGTDCSMMVACR